MTAYNYLKLAWRNVVRDKRSFALNVAGLSAGIASVFLLIAIIRFENSYDKFHTHGDRIYRVVSQRTFSNDVIPNPGVPGPVPKALKMDVPDLELVVPVMKYYGECLLTFRDSISGQPVKYQEKNLVFTTPDFFRMFDQQWLSGVPEELNMSGRTALTRSFAEKLFGDWREAVGKTIFAENFLPLEVAGVIEDSPANTNLPVGVVISFETLKAHADLLGYDEEGWGATSGNFQLYIMPGRKMGRAALEKHLDAFNKKHFDREELSGNSISLQPLHDIHFDPDLGALGGNMVQRSTIRSLSLIAVVIILMVSFNFINMALARYAGEGKKIGVRKILGANRSSIAAYSLLETLLIVAISTMIGGALVTLSLPYLSLFSNIPETFSLVSWDAVLFVGGLLLLLTLLAGIYPAIVISRFKPLQAIRDKLDSPVTGMPLSKVLLSFQFGIAYVLLVCTLIATLQMNFIRETDLGFNKEAIYYFSLPWDETRASKAGALKEELLQIAAVRSVSLSTDVPLSNINWSSNFYFDRIETDQPFFTYLKYADADFFDTYGIRFLSGSSFAQIDTIYQAVINETMMRRLGLTDAADAVGKSIKIGGETTWRQIVGVAKDFNTNSLKEDIKPLIIAPKSDWYQLAGIRLVGGVNTKTLDMIESIWDRHFPEHIYTGYFLDERIAGYYVQESKATLTYRVFALLAIFIACMGLFGIISTVAARRTKEIGIRKVLGSTIRGIVILLSGEFVILIGIAILFASPVAWWAMNHWLKDFVFRIEIKWWVFVATGLGAIALALLTISFQTIRAAAANPVKSLRTE